MSRAAHPSYKGSFDALLSERETADYFGTTIAGLDAFRAAGRLHPIEIATGVLAYDPDEVASIPFYSYADRPVDPLDTARGVLAGMGVGLAVLAIGGVLLWLVLK